ncbi:Vacuolar protein sorting-associated protein IST1 [Penicillium rolfsii]|nr:Vacuolar protein sorting-associated protein IST1 [Penicillium rolfsii]
MPPSAQTTRLVSTLRLLIPRLRLLQKKDTASSVVQRRELSQLLSENREASARIRVENVIATDIAVEVMEMVELYCELLLARANVLDQLAFGEKGTRARLRAKELLKKQTQAQSGEKATAVPESSGSRFGFSWLGGSQKKEASTMAATNSLEGAGELSEEEIAYMDTALDEAAVAIFYAWHRFPHELRELTMLRTMLGERYGKEFMTMAQDNKVDTVKVPDRLLKGLRVRPPTQELVENYLREIAKAYGVDWPAGEELEGHAALGDAPPEFVDDAQGDSEGGDLPQTPRKQSVPPASQPNLTEARRASETSELNKATPPRGPAALQGRSPVSVAPPAPRTDNPNPRVKVPGSEEDGGNATKKAGAGKTNNSGIPELDELTRRFADLKRKS